MEWKNVAEVSAGATAAGGFLWFIFRFLVGAAVADAVSDISVLKSEVEALKLAIQGREDKLDQLLLALASK